MNLHKIGLELDKRISDADEKSYADQGIGLIPKDIEMKIMGQMALLADEEISSRIELNATFDVDAHIKASVEVLRILDQLLKENGLALDMLSDEIWMPPDTVWETFYEGDYVKILKARPTDVLVSKAVKAPIKNKRLIMDAIAIYGEELAGRIDKFGGRSSFFK
tara:strand:+ start:1228 stop:1719 length:492 start_codon:yes stop_codon:yes gene_type:complete